MNICRAKSSRMLIAISWMASRVRNRPLASVEGGWSWPELEEGDNRVSLRYYLIAAECACIIGQPYDAEMKKPSPHRSPCLSPSARCAQLNFDPTTGLFLVT
jgi:hypothetical protein